MVRWRILVACIAAVISGSALAQAKTWRIAYLTGYSVDVDRPLQAAFRQGLKDLGYIDTRNFRLEVRHAAGRPEQMDRLAQELAGQNPDIFIAAGGADAALSIRKFAGHIPIVMANVQDPVTSGLVSNLARPGGNITGMSDFHAASVTKRVELMREAVPKLRTIGVLWNESSAPSANQLKDVQQAAAKLGLRTVSLPIRQAADIDETIGRLKGEQNAGLLLLGDYVLTTHMKQIARRAIDLRIPAGYTLRDFAEQGGLMAYGTDFQDLYRRSAYFVDRIFRGAKPGELAIEQPTKFYFIVNLRTAKAVGVTLPGTVITRADRVIE